MTGEKPAGKLHVYRVVSPSILPLCAAIMPDRVDKPLGTSEKNGDAENIRVMRGGMISLYLERGDRDHIADSWCQRTAEILAISRRKTLSLLRNVAFYLSHLHLAYC